MKRSSSRSMVLWKKVPRMLLVRFRKKWSSNSWHYKKKSWKKKWQNRNGI